MSPNRPPTPGPMRPSAESGRKVHALKDPYADKGLVAEDDDEELDADDADDMDPDAGDEPREDPAAIDPQVERAESEGMVTEHAKVSATDPGPEPLPEPEPEPEPEPDYGPEDPVDPPEHD